MARIRSQGLVVELTHPDTSRTVRPDVLDDPEILPSLNALAEIRVPVRKSADWLEWPTGATMAAWLDGNTLPLDELVRVEQQAGRTVLVGEGGVELRSRQTEEFDTKRRTDAATTIIENAGYTADVDTPNVDTNERTMQSPDSQSEFNDVLTTAETDPVEVTSGGVVRCFPTAIYDVGDNFSGNGFFEDAEAAPDGYTSNENTDLGVGHQVGATQGESFSWSFDVGYTMPSGSWTVLWRRGNADNDPTVGRIEVSVDGNVVEFIGKGITVSGGVSWAAPDSAGFDLTPGTHTVEVACTDTTDMQTTPEDLKTDVLGVQDQRFTYNLDNDIDANHNLDGPETHPDGFEVVFDDATTIFLVVAGRIDLTMDDVTGSQRVQLSNDQGSTWRPNDGTEDNTTSVDVDPFPDDEQTTIRCRVRIDRWEPNGAQNATPTQGYASQELDAYGLFADIEEVSLLIDETFDTDGASILTEIAGDRFLWSYRDDGGGGTVAFTQPGQRTAGADPEIKADISTEKNLDVYEKVTIKGANDPVTEERWTATVGTAVSLANSPVLPGSETVYDPSDGTNFDRGDDYSIDYQSGEITALSNGSLTDSTTYHVDYRFEIAGSHTVDGAPANPRELVQTIPGITASRTAEQVAFVLADELDSARYTADIVLPRAARDFDPVEALSLGALDLPAAATPLATREPPERTPTGIALRLGSRRRLEAALSDISDRVRAVSRRS